MVDYYQVLGLSYNITISSDDIKSAYKRKVLTEHPDKGGSAERFQLLQKAYETLSNPHKKYVYDQSMPRPSSYHRTGMPTPLDLSAIIASMHRYTWTSQIPKASSTRPERKSKVWTPEEEKQLLDKLAEGKSYKRIGEELGRTSSAVSHRVSVIACRLQREGRSQEEILRVIKIQRGGALKALLKKLNG